MSSGFFMDCSWVEAQVQEQGRIVIDTEKYTRLLTQPVQCFRCGWAASVESLKKHHLECAAPLPGGAAACRGWSISQHARKENEPAPPALPPSTASTGTVAKKADNLASRFANDNIRSQTPSMTTTSRGRGGAGGGEPRWRRGGSRSGGESWRRGRGRGEGRDTGWGRRDPSDWKKCLWKYLEEPREAELENDVYYEDDLCVVIYDKYPKAKYHLLLIAKGPPVKLPIDLRLEHLLLRRRLHDVGRAIAEALSQQGAGAVRCGYHAIPSLEPLHVHIISQDFDSAGLKRPTHWNSFTTDFFLDCSWVEMRLEELGSLELDMDMYKRLEHQPMLCFRCGWEASGMPSIKKHNLQCTAPLPGGAAESCSKSA